MIEAKELRAGNYVLENGQVVMLSVVSMVVTVDREVKNKEMPLDPIILSNELLTKCGFTYIETGSHRCEWQKDALYLNQLTCNSYMEGVGESVEIKYLHHLQNLYYFKIGKELEINL